MLRTRASTTGADMSNLTEIPAEPEKTLGSEEQVDLDGENEPEETIEEEVEYEEVEEDEEFEEIEEVVEEEVEEEVEADDIDLEEENEEAASEAYAQKGSDCEEEKDERNKQAELLALPPHGSEVYLGGITHDTSEEDLRGFCESIGEVAEVRIMKGKDSSEAKGYAFVSFRTKELASKAIKELNNTELKGKKVRCSTSQVNHRLFIGNVPRNWGEEDMKKVVNKIGPGVISIELLKDPQNSSRNRGYAFIEYYNHACAEYSRKKMSNSNFKLDDNSPTVSWADPRNAGSSAASQVKAVYVKNLPKDITQECLRQLFEHHGKVTKVVLPPAKAGHEESRYGFVHFAERSSAMKALKNTEKYEIDGQVLDCSLAKPHAEQKSSGGPSSQKPILPPAYPPHIGYGLVGSPYGALGASYGAAGIAQPVIYGGGPTPTGMAMTPMLLPDGRIGYILQQPGMQSHSAPLQPHGGRGSGQGRGSGSGGRRGNNGSRGHSRYNPY